MKKLKEKVNRAGMKTRNVAYPNEFTVCLA